jgi:diadenosine tetraphosphate (Ap4A) HIT family hydrolase
MVIRPTRPGASHTPAIGAANQASPGADPTAESGVAAPIDRTEVAPKVLQADQKIRTSSLSASGPTKTTIPDLLSDWKRSVLVAAAREAARAELMPEAQRLLDEAATQKGAPLADDEIEPIVDAFFERERGRLKTLQATHLQEFDKGPKERDRTIQRVVLEERPRVQALRDPFTPVALKDPTARAREVVLWENADAMVLVDLFATSPKALVIPKQPVMLALDAPDALLKDLALVAAHVSDALIDVSGAPPAGIWVNPPQDLTVRQMHVHVLPDLPDWLAFVGAGQASDASAQGGRRPVRAIQAAKDPQVLAQMQSFFQTLTKAIEQRLGPST